MTQWILRCAILSVLCLSACNLSDQQAPTPEIIVTETTVATQDATADAQPSALPGVMTVNPNPNALPTRTPMGNPLVATPLQFVPNDPNGQPNTAPVIVPTSETGESATINAPAHNSTIYTGTLQIQGVVRGLTKDEFTISVVAPNNQPINTQLISLNNPNNANEIPWSAMLQISRYTGPAEITITAENPTGQSILLAKVNVTVEPAGAGTSGNNSNAPTRTDSAAITIQTPNAGETVSGDPLQISGTVGGIETQQFALELVSASGTVLSSQTITYTSSAPTVIVPWSASLGTGGYTGSATIRATHNGETLANLNIQLQ